MNMQSENQPHVSCTSTSPPVKLCLAGAFSMQGFGQLLNCEAVAMWLSPTFSNDPLETSKKNRENVGLPLVCNFSFYTISSNP